MIDDVLVLRKCYQCGDSMACFTFSKFKKENLSDQLGVHHCPVQVDGILLPTEISVMFNTHD